MLRQLSLQHSNVAMEDVIPTLEGQLYKLPPLSTRNVRVFLSSTFSDMIQERNALTEHVYPRLKNLCREKYRLEFQMIDLRWGLREESQDDHTIIEFCIREIENCKKSSIGPCFVALLGQKYGYRSFPSRVDATVFDKIRDVLISYGNNVSQLETWFKKDTNALPPVYILQPISSILKHYKDKDNTDLFQKDQNEWDKTFKELLQMLRLGVVLCVENGTLSQQDKDIFFISVTEYEIERGMLMVEDPTNTTFCITRNISNLEENIHHKRAAKFIDLIPSMVTPQPPNSASKQAQRLSTDSKATYVTSLSVSPTASLEDKPLYESTSGSVSPSLSPGLEQRFTRTLTVPSLTLPAPVKSQKTISQAVLFTISTPGIRTTRPQLRLETGTEVSPWSTPAVNMEIDRDAQQMLYELQHDKIHQVLPPDNLAHFDIEWIDPEETNPTENTEYLQHFMETFEAQMLKLIERAVRKQKSISRNSHIVEILQHLTMCRQRSQVFRGREEILQKIQFYLSEPATEPLVLYGLSGSGKTSVLAKSASLVRHWLPECSPAILIRFLGTTSQSCSIRLVLSNICWQLASLAAINNMDIPGDYPGLVAYFHNILKHAATPDRPLVLFLDSLDQLTSAHRAHNLSWLPRQLPPYVHLVLSTLPYEHDLLDTLRVLITSDMNYIQILPLGQVLSKSLIKEWLDSAKRDLSAAQFDVVSDALSKCSLPLYTRLVFEEVCRWSSFSPPDQTRLQFTVKGIINKLLDKVEKYHGRVFVSHALSYLTASKNGLSDVELEDVLSLDEEVLNDVFQHWLPPIRRIPPLLIPRLHDELSSYIMQREANGTIVYYWYHRQFIFVARDRYLSNIAHRIYIHTSLAHYFLGTWGAGKCKPFRYSPMQMALMSVRRKENDVADRKVPVQPLSYGPDPHMPERMIYNLRKLSELPYHLVESRQYLVFKQEVLLNYDWIYAKLSAMSLHDVLSDYRQAIEAGLGSAEVSLVFSALRVGGTYVNQNPDTLAFDLLGRLLVYYDSNMGIKELLQQCDIKGAKHSAIIPLFQSFESPRAMLLYVLEDHTQSVIDLVFTQQELISVSKDGTVAFWDLSSGECTRNIDISVLSPGPNTRLYVTRDGQRLVVDSDAINSPVYVYDMKTGQLLHQCGRRLPTQRRSFLVGNLLCRQKNIIDIREGRVLTTLDDFVRTKRYVTCSITPDQRYILIGEDMVTKLFEFERGTLLQTYPNENLPCVFAITDDSKRAYVGYVDDCLFKVLDIDVSSQTFGSTLMLFNYRTAMSGSKFIEGLPQNRELCEIAISPVNNRVVILNIKRTNLVRYDTVKQEAKLLDLKPINATNKTYLFGLTCSFGGKYVMVGDEKFLHIWENSEAAPFISTINLHSTSGFPIAISHTRNLVATGSTIHTAIKVWDFDKIDVADKLDGTVYECPIDTMVCAPARRLVFVKNYSKGYQHVDSFGIDVWNISTGNCITYLPPGRYGKLVQMEVSPDGQQVALLLNARDTYVALINTKTNKISNIEVSGCHSMHFSTHWEYLCTSSLHEPVNELRLWNIKSGDLIVPFYQAEHPVFTLDNKFLLYIDSGQTIITYCLLKMAPLKYVACQAEQLLVLPVKHRFVLATHWTVTNKTPTVNGSDGEHHRNIQSPPLFNATKNQEDLLGGSRYRGHVSPSVMLWNYIEGRQVARLEDVAPGGVRSISCDGRFAVDGYLQVYDLETGKIRTELGDDCDDEREFTFVRLTHDGCYVIWVDKVSVKAKRVSDGALVAHISTHERPTSLCVLDYGYIIALGREDGRVLIMRLIVDLNEAGDKWAPIRTNTVFERVQMLLDQHTCNDEALNRMDLTCLVTPHDVRDSDVTKASEHVRTVLVNRAKVPLLKSGPIVRNQDTCEKYCRSFSHLPPGLVYEFREGSPITHGGCSSSASTMPRNSPLFQLGASGMERSGSTPCIEATETPSDGEIPLIDITPPASADIESPLQQFNHSAGTLFDKRSASDPNVAMLLTLQAPKSHKKHSNKHGTFSNTPRNRCPLPDYAEPSTPRNCQSGLPPTPSTGRRRFLGALIDWSATLRAKRKKSKQRAPIDADGRDRMPSV